jgi:branched-chain amino acid transport system substrate-binding protein
MVPVYYSDVALIAVQAKEIGLTAKLLGADGWDGVLEKIDKSNLDSVKDCYFCSQYSAESTDPNLQNFLKQYKETYKTDANMFAVLGYDAMGMMCEAIKTAGSTDSDKIIAAMKGLSYKGLTGTTTFDENRNPVREAVITTIADGKYKFVENFKK